MTDLCCGAEPPIYYYGASSSASTVDTTPLAKQMLKEPVHLESQGITFEYPCYHNSEEQAQNSTVSESGYGDNSLYNTVAPGDPTKFPAGGKKEGLDTRTKRSDTSQKKKKEAIRDRGIAGPRSWV
ncbi:hypothetical protein B7463_g6032, partial [Scytalidium lignicola]